MYADMWMDLFKQSSLDDKTLSSTNGKAWLAYLGFREGSKTICMLKFVV